MMLLEICKKAVFGVFAITCMSAFLGCAARSPVKVPPAYDLGTKKDFGCVCAADPGDPQNEILIIGKAAFSEAVYVLVEKCGFNPNRDELAPVGTLDLMQCECKLIPDSYRDEYYVTDQDQVGFLIIQINQCLMEQSARR
jgi:hypothetical protein